MACNSVARQASGNEILHLLQVLDDVSLGGHSKSSDKPADHVHAQDGHDMQSAAHAEAAQSLHHKDHLGAEHVQAAEPAAQGTVSSVLPQQISTAQDVLKQRAT